MWSAPACPLLLSDNKPFLWPGHMTTGFHKPDSAASLTHYICCTSVQLHGTQCTRDSVYLLQHSVLYLRSGALPFWTHKDMISFLQVTAYLLFLLVMCSQSQVLGCTGQCVDTKLCFWDGAGQRLVITVQQQRLSCTLDRLKTETLTLQTSQSLTRVFKCLWFHRVKSGQDHIMTRQD